jgi:hypothetical protein
MGMTVWTADTVSRTAIILTNSGEAPTLEAACEALNRLVLQVRVGDIGANRTLQAAVLTIVNSAARAFLGGVHVDLVVDTTVTTGWCNGVALSEAIKLFGGELVDTLAPEHPTICVGEPGARVVGRPVLRATASGWTAGVVEGDETPLVEMDTFVPAGVAAGGIAVAEAFEYLRSTNVYAGRRERGISLWRPGEPWTSEAAAGPDDVAFAPAAWWLVGLGHLGQGYLWSIGMLTYSSPDDVRVLLQDDDVVTEANESTGLLLPRGSVTTGADGRKTRVLAGVLEQRGFRTTITERRLGPGDGPRHDEPRLALVGVDNPETRQRLSESNFALIIDAGLGAGPSHYLDLQVHTLPSDRRSDTIASWQAPKQADPGLLGLPAYQQLIATTGDECGAVEIAGRTVAASFVGATAGALVVAEATRSLRGEHRHSVIDATLRDLERVHAVEFPAPPVPNLGFAALR